MTTKSFERPQIEKMLSGLKDFQKDTVDYVFHRLFLDEDCTSRFLIADEVGLGKTLVARGLIAKTVDHLWDKVDRIDVIYICSNQEIARQNIDRLNITDERGFQHASRATLLPITIDQLRGKKLNFVSLTPGTSFDLRSSTGLVWERVVLFNLLRDAWKLPGSTLQNVLRGDVGKKRWQGLLKWFDKNKIIDRELQDHFLNELNNQPQLHQQYDRVAALIGGRRKNINYEMRVERNKLLGALRRLLAKTSLAALEPDLIILDEFQRFKYLLEDDNDFAMLAQCLFDFPNAKILLLSATPYKMYTMQAEQNENHYADLERTINFLFNHQTNVLEKFQLGIKDFRNAMLYLESDLENQHKLRNSKTLIENILRKVMVRTERLAVSTNRNGMLEEKIQDKIQITDRDLISFVNLDQLSKILNVGDQIEYWKSSSYYLNLMEDYRLKKEFEQARHKNPEIIFENLTKANPFLLNWTSFQEYQRIDPGNARLRSLINDTVESGNWKNLWLPPSLPYYLPEGVFCDLDDRGKTKTLIFSAWRIVPKVISMLMSYEVERRMLGDGNNDIDYSELTIRRRPLLRFAISRERLTGMSVFDLLYPCLTLASKIDPLNVARNSLDSRLTLNIIQSQIRKNIEDLLQQSLIDKKFETESQVIDERWYWAALLLMDSHFFYKEVSEWLNTEDSDLAWPNMLKIDDDDEKEGRFSDHVAEIRRSLININSLELGRRPDDLIDVLTNIAIASPAVTSLRGLLRITDTNVGFPSFLAAAAQIGLGFRTLFNQPDATAMLQDQYLEGPYWQKALNYCVHGNLQAVIDEYMHVLLESLGLKEHDDLNEIAEKIGNTIRQALSIRAPSLRFDEIILDENSKQINLEKRGVRCRYALRFGDEKSEDYLGGSRDTDVRIAFNSPFRPFILSTTSVGQEGLDFHQYCHRVVHWNLPSNPVDLEQREGRVHRYKCHVIRRNLATNYGLSSLNISTGKLFDPWKQLFKLAIEDRSVNANDLVPFWIYDQGKYKIERIVPMLPLSRENASLKRLKKALVIYRSVIGQPRQEELIKFLEEHFTQEEISKILLESIIDLSPPKLNNFYE